MKPAIKCSSCAHAVLTGILPNGVHEYACCKSNDLKPFFYYSIDPDRVDGCVDYSPLKPHKCNSPTITLDTNLSYYDYE